LALSAGFILFKKRSTVHLGLIIPPLVYFALAVLSRFNLGVRHLLPVYPFLFVLIGGTVDNLWRDGSRVMRSSLVLLGVCYLGSALSSYPHYLSYFNEVAGGATHGHKVLLDSNLDWGQDLKGLKKWMDANAVKKIQLFYFGTAQPKYYGIDDFYSTENLTNQKSADSASIALPQYLAISANFRYGKELFLPKELTDLVASYQFGQPVTTIGHSILVYQLNLSDSRVYENAGILAERKGALNVAIALFRKALQVNPSRAIAHQSLARALAQQGKIDEARQHYQEALRILKQDRDAANRKR
jgi:tetratricopeptide (TPR) repeat protein